MGAYAVVGRGVARVVVGVWFRRGGGSWGEDRGETPHTNLVGGWWVGRMVVGVWSGRGAGSGGAGFWATARTNLDPSGLALLAV